MTTIGEDHLQPRGFPEQSLEQVCKTLSVRIVCKTSHHAEQEPGTVNQVPPIVL